MLATLATLDAPPRTESLPSRPALKVAVVTETWPPEVNGVARTIARAVEGLQARGHALQLVRPRQRGSDGIDDTRASELLTGSLPIPRYPQLRMGLPCTRTLLRQWRASRPDVVHIVTEGPLGWSALQAASRLDLPVVSDFRTNFHAYSRHYGVGWLGAPVTAYLRRFHNRCASTMVPTEALRRELGDAGFERLRVVARGVDTRAFDPSRRSPALRASWGAGPEQRVVLYVGRLAAEKNLGLLVDAAEAMRREDPLLRLVLVGDGPERARLAQRCPWAHFAGLRRGDDLAAHYASADVFVFPSLTETFGNVVTEAMASALAVIAYDHAAAGQLIRSGENGLLAPAGDAAAFCAVATSLAREPGRARALGARAREGTRPLDWGRIVAAIELEYLAAVGHRTGRAWRGRPVTVDA